MRSDAITFVYRCNSCGNWWTVYAGEPLICPKCKSKERTHTATIDPATIIARMLNGEDVVNDLKRFDEHQ
jgi:DNA-directed RNA polymerase subunit RPC12/RpoP